MRDGGEVIQKIAKRMAAREVVDERLEGDASSYEYGCASENLGIDVNDAFAASQVQNRNRICWPFAYRGPTRAKQFIVWRDATARIWTSSQRRRSPREIRSPRLFSRGSGIGRYDVAKFAGGAGERS